MSTFIALSKLDKLEDYVSSSSLLDMQRGENIKRKREPRSSVFLDVSSMLVYHRCLENWNNEFPLIILLFFSFFLSFFLSVSSKGGKISFEEMLIIDPPDYDSR